MTSPVVVEVRDQAGTPLGLLRDWGNLEWVDRYGDVGTGKVDCRASDHNRELVQAGAIIAVRDDTGVLQSGPLPEFGEAAVGGESSLRLSWKNSNEWLRRRVCYPNPRAAIPDGATLTVASDARKGATSTVIMGYVNANLGPGALSVRRLPGLAMGRDDRVGVVLTAAVEARFDNLLTLSRQLAITGGCAFAIDTDDRQYTFNVWQVADLSADVKFSAQVHNLRESSFTVKAPDATTVIVGGKGEDEARVFAEAVSAASAAEAAVWGRIEAFRDDRSAEGDAMLASAMRDLSESSATIAADFEPLNRALVYGRDYRLGDLVTCVLRPGLSVVKPVREVTTSVSMAAQDRVVKPIAGDYGATSSTGAQFQTRQLIETVAALKRNR